MPDFLIIWLALCTLLVLLMQAGFTCFEAGMVRRKNSTNVALKNAADVSICIILFLFIGYPLMFGQLEGVTSSFIGFGPSPLFGDNPVTMLEALYQAMFAGTAITIISGAVSERTTFRGYLILAFFMSILIYPVSGHWAWSQTGWLNQLGFYDYAGGSVVHVVGGAIALAAIIIIGPRVGRFGNNSGIEPSNLSIATLGMLILFFGWFGFNAGAATSFQDDIPLILVNTGLGATSGLFVVLLLVIFGKLNPSPNSVLCSPIAGLVSVTAGCAVLTPLGAFILGLIGAGAALSGIKFLEKLKLDDPVSAIPVHMFAGVLGTILLPFFAYESAVPEDMGRTGWFLIQLFGTSVISIYAFAMTFIFMKISKGFIAYRVSEKDEMIGLNVAEHNAETAMFELIRQMSAQGEKGEFSQPIAAEPGTDASYIAFFYNQVRDKFLNEANRSQALLEEANYHAFHDTLTGLHNRRAYNEAARGRFAELKRYNKQFAIIMIDIDFFKKINDTYGHDVGDEVLQEFGSRLKSISREGDIVARIGGEEFSILAGLEGVPHMEVPAERLREAIANKPFETLSGPLNLTASIGVVVVDQSMTFDQAVKIADKLLYKAKAEGRNCVRLNQTLSNDK